MYIYIFCKATIIDPVMRYLFIIDAQGTVCVSAFLCGVWGNHTWGPLLFSVIIIERLLSLVYDISLYITFCFEASPLDIYGMNLLFDVFLQITFKVLFTNDESICTKLLVCKGFHLTSQNYKGKIIDFSYYVSNWRKQYIIFFYFLS